MHVPASHILGKPLFQWPLWTAFLAPLSGIVLFGVMYLVFRRAMRFYRSAGS
jgi:ABC-2 type transport system permease protein